jgi:hypothetical protein
MTRRSPRLRSPGGPVLLQAPRIERLEPSRVLLVTLLLYLGALVVLPLVPTEPASGLAIFYWLLLAVMALVGLRTARVIVQPSRRAVAIDIARTATRLVYTGAFGVALLCLDRYVLRGAPLSFEILDVRQAVENAGGGAFSMVAAGLGAFALTALILLSIARRDGAHFSFGMRALAWLSVGFYVLLSIAQGSRSVLLSTVLSYLFAVSIMDAGYAKRRRGLSPRTYGPVAVLLLVVVSVWLMLKRLNEMGVDPLTSIRLSGYAEAVQAPEWLYALIEGNAELGPILAALLSLVLYVFHGFYEFSTLVRDFASPHTGGVLVLWLPTKVLSILSGVPLGVDLESLNGVRIGIYTTFAGPVFMDFGWWGLLVQWPLFVLIGLPAALRWKQRNELWLPAAASATTMIVMYPVLSFLDSAAGLYPLVAGALVPMMASRNSASRSVSPAVLAPGATHRA